MSGADLSRNEILQMVVRVSLVSLATYFSVKWMIDKIDPTCKAKKKAKERAEGLLRRLGFKEGKLSNLSEYEMVIAAHLVVPDDINVSWKDIAGLDDVVQELKESVVLPVKHRGMFHNSSLYQAPKGVLLHGPPGCGKTLIAKATAKEAGMRFINLDVAMLTDKWYGESQKLASAVFSLALKIQPCIIFIDEIDSFLRSRNTNDHEATAMMKTQFMMLWDGLSTGNESTVIVMGATNRPGDLDKAIIRRMPAQFHVALPNEEQRLKILKLILENEQISPNLNFVQLAKVTNTFSGSDLRELCRNASVYRIRTYLREHCDDLDEEAKKAQENPLTESATNTSLPEITMEDLMTSLQKMKLSKMHTGLMGLEMRSDLD
ncbi:CLUMA_CG009083, isoform A [Clunio marinus]|uniref:CLUMA_CG009083, isoform A n=1 Tax=Clunio marinus TaxID=568069 RepID=A0A1J1IB09_9DIPT|nr:CLUMA_CG009083, isoform A [Clunio marinus]